jgi:uncharacterized protein (TIGR03067 family)
MIEGTWKLISGEQEGHDEPEDVIKLSKLEIAGDQHTVSIGDAVMRGTHKLDTSQDPMTIDSMDSAGRFKNVSLKGIFKLEDDVFSVCFGKPGGSRPTEFTTRDGKASILHVWRRQS